MYESSGVSECLLHSIRQLLIVSCLLIGDDQVILVADNFEYSILVSQQVSESKLLTKLISLLLLRRETVKTWVARRPSHARQARN